jgi:hypothetical protein
MREFVCKVCIEDLTECNYECNTDCNCPPYCPHTGLACVWEDI